MDKGTELKNIVKEKYGEIAVNTSNTGCGCGCGCGDEAKIVGYTVMEDDYEGVKGYVPEADLKLGCGMPVEHANIKKGDVVVDLGSGAGNDVFVALALVGETGKVYGIDMTPEMIAKAEKNKAKLGYENVEFRLGEIEDIPLKDNAADVVVSNCVFNLVPNKEKAFSELYRIIKPGGHFCISDIVIIGELPPELQKSAEMYAGCVAGAIQQDEYIGLIVKNGFKNVEIKTTKVIDLPDEVLLQYQTPEQIASFRKNKTGIFSITVVGTK